METFELEAQPRNDQGKGASRRLRRTGMAPAIIYGAGQDPRMIALDHDKLVHHLELEAFYSHILTIKVADTVEQVILKDLQRHPAKPFITHADFQRIDEKSKLRTHVPLHYMNEATCPGVKAGGIVNHHLADVEVDCLPKDLPEFIEVDLAALDVGQSVLLSELKLPAGVAIHALIQGPENDVPVVTIHSKGAGVSGEEEDEAEA